MLSGIMESEQLKALGSTSFPILVTNIVFFLKSSVSMYFLSRLGDNELAAGSLSIAFASITGYSTLKGMSTGMEPICSQAYGAKKWGILSQTYRKTLILLLLICIPIVSLLWLNMEHILLFIGHDKEIISLAMIHIVYSIPELLAQAFLYPLRALLRTQKMNTPVTWSAICALFLHVLISYLFVFYFKLGIKGVTLATACNTISVNIGLLIYIIVSDGAIKPWDNIANDKKLEGWWPLISLAMPSTLSVCLEWWVYEIMLLLCGLLKNPQAAVSAMGILIQMTGLLYTVPSSLSSGLSTLVGHQLGADDSTRATQTTVMGLTVSIVWGFLAFILTILLKNTWARMFTLDGDILMMTSIALPILGLCEIGNCPQTAACGILIGSARPKMGCWINVWSFYFIGLPISVILGFKLDMGFRGLWLGLVAAQFSCLSMMIYTLARTDWKHQAKRARELTQATGGPMNDLETNLLY